MSHPIDGYVFWRNIDTVPHIEAKHDFDAIVNALPDSPATKRVLERLVQFAYQQGRADAEFDAAGG